MRAWLTLKRWIGSVLGLLRTSGSGMSCSQQAGNNGRWVNLNGKNELERGRVETILQLVRSS